MCPDSATTNVQQNVAEWKGSKSVRLLYVVAVQKIKTNLQERPILRSLLTYHYRKKCKTALYNTAKRRITRITKQTSTSISDKLSALSRMRFDDSSTVRARREIASPLDTEYIKRTRASSQNKQIRQRQKVLALSRMRCEDTKRY